MGRKITIDSATLMNKGLEVIEAHWLFGMPRRTRSTSSSIRSRSCIRWSSCRTDRSSRSWASPTCGCRFSTRSRIRIAGAGALPPLDLARLGALEFGAPDLERFPCLRLAYRRAQARRRVADRAQRGQRSGRRGVSGRAAGVSRHSRASSSARWRRRSATSTRRHALADVRAADAWARTYSAETIGTLPSS